MNRSILYAALERCHEHDITDDEDSDEIAKQRLCFSLLSFWTEERRADNSRTHQSLHRAGIFLTWEEGGV
jgi:hypothetical protein